MAYEKNSERLAEIMETHDYGLREDNEQFLAKSEQERIQSLKRVFNEDISKFETIPLWENDVPGYDSKYKLQNRPQIVFFPGMGGKCTGAVLVVPGGGYNCKVSQSEGYPYIDKLVRVDQQRRNRHLPQKIRQVELTGKFLLEPQFLNPDIVFDMPDFILQGDKFHIADKHEPEITDQRLGQLLNDVIFLRAGEKENDIERI